MQFIVTRASTWDTVKPCDEAFAKTHKAIRYVNVQATDFLSMLEEQPAYKTVEHEVTITEWLVEINSLEELILFTVKYGDCIVNQNTIEINDEEGN